MKFTMKALVAGCSMAMLASSPLALAANNNPSAGAQNGSYSQEKASDARETVTEAVKVLHQMEKDPEVAKLLKKSEGVFIVPDFATASLLVGGKGGEGAMIQHKNGKWSNPVFYDIGGMSLGLQAGASAGSIAMILTSDKAVNGFKGDNNFSLNANAGISIVNYSANSQASVGKGGDIVVWSDTEGALAQANVGVSDLSYDDEENQAYYQQQTSTQEIISGDVKNPHKQTLQKALSNI